MNYLRNDTQHNNKKVSDSALITLRITTLDAKCCHAECRIFYRYAECHYTDYHYTQSRYARCRNTEYH